MLSPTPSLTTLTSASQLFNNSSSVNLPNSALFLTNPMLSTTPLITSMSPLEGVPIFLMPNSQNLTPFPLLQQHREMKVNWATHTSNNSSTILPKVDTSRHFHIFVGDLSPEIDNKALQEAFAPFGDVSDAKVIRDLQTIKSKGYGFVSFPKKEEAEKAIEQMNGQWLGRRTIRTNWATRKPAEISRDDVYSSTGPSNMTVYVGGINSNTSEEDLRGGFQKFGNIAEVRIFKSQCYAFVRFDSKESAANAILAMNGQEFQGQTVKCSWGRAGQEPVSSAANYYGYALGSNNSNSAAQQQYWNYYQQALNNPQIMHQWQNYWAQGGQ